jgi:cytochrome P450
MSIKEMRSASGSESNPDTNGASRLSTGMVIPTAGPRNQLAGTLAFKRDQLGFLAKAIRKHPDIFRLQLLPIPLVMVNHPDYVQHVLVDNNQNYNKDSALYRTVRPVLRNGLIGAIGGEAWHRQRRLMQPSFHRPKTAAFVTNMTEETNAMLSRWQVKYPSDEVVSVIPEIGNLALRIVTRTLFGADVGPSTEALERDFTSANKIMGRFFRFPFPPLSFPTPSHRELRRLISRLDEYVDDLVRWRRTPGNDGHDLLTALASAIDEDTGEPMSVQQLHEEVVNIMVGGYETTTNAAAWLLYHVAKNQAVQERIHGELDSVLAGRTPDFADLSRLRYTRMVVDETLRLTTPAWQTMRGAIGDDEIGGYSIPRGTGIYINFLMLHRHPAFWPDPEKFDPERFTPENIAKRPRNAYIPFASGPRICIGKHFALSELQIVIAMVLQAYRISLPAGHPVEMHPMITLRPKPGVSLYLERR